MHQVLSWGGVIISFCLVNVTVVFSFFFFFLIVFFFIFTAVYVSDVIMHHPRIGHCNIGGVTCKFSLVVVLNLLVVIGQKTR